MTIAGHSGEWMVEATSNKGAEKHIEAMLNDKEEEDDIEVEFEDYFSDEDSQTLYTALAHICGTYTKMQHIAAVTGNKDIMNLGSEKYQERLQELAESYEVNKSDLEDLAIKTLDLIEEASKLLK